MKDTNNTEKIDLIQKKARRRLRALLAVLLLGTSVSLVTSVFAYNSAASLLRITGINISTLLPAEIKLGMKNKTDTTAIDYYDELTPSILADHLSDGSVLQVDGKDTYNYGYTPVSSAFTSKWLVKGEDGTYDSLMPKFSTEYVSNAFRVNGVDSPCFFPGYANSSDCLSMELYLKETDQASLPVDVYLDSSTFVKANSAYNKQVASATTPNLNSEELDRVVNSLRISVLTSDGYYIIDPKKDEDNPTYLCGRVNLLGDDSYYDTYSGNFGGGYFYYKEAMFGEFDATTFDKMVWDSPSDTDSALVGSSSVFNAQTAANISSLNVSKSVANGVKLKEENSYSLASFTDDTSEDDEEKVSLCKLIPGEEAKRIVVSFYIEGWDTDNINSVQYASFLSSIVLTGEYDYTYTVES